LEARTPTALLILLSCALSLTPAAPASPWRCPDALSEAQQEALETASESPEYVVRISTGTIAGVPRIVVLLGERHAKSPSAARIGERVLDAFDVRGIEGVDFSRYWAAPILEPVYDRSYARLVERMGGGSTCEAAWERAPDPGGTPARRVVELEADHRPGLREQWDAAMTAAGILTANCHGLLGGCAAALGLMVLPEPVRGACVGAALSGAALWALFRGFGPGAAERSLLGRTYGAWRRYLERSGIVGGRNVTMAAAIARAFSDDPALRVILVIVGRAHVDGLARLLREDQGF